MDTTVEFERQRADRLHLALTAARALIGGLVARHNNDPRPITISVYHFDKVLAETAPSKEERR